MKRFKGIPSLALPGTTSLLLVIISGMDLLGIAERIRLAGQVSQAGMTF